VLAGVLIGLFSPATVLVVDGCTYIFSFLVILTVVRAGKRVEAAAQQKGVFSGLKFLFGDSLLGPIMIAACAINFVAQGIVLGVQAIDYFRYDASGYVIAFLFAGFCVGALLGAIVAQQLTQKVPLLKLAAIAIVLMPLPLFLLSPTTPWPAAVAIIAAFAFFTPLINAPIIGILTVRTPVELRPKVMTAVMTVASLAGPLGFIAASQAIGRVSIYTVFFVIAAALTAGGFAFAAVLLRNRAAPDLVAMPDVAHS